MSETPHPLEAEHSANQVSQGDHFVQFYESDIHLVGCVSNFLIPALEAGDAALVLATPRIIDGIKEQLELQDFRTDRLTSSDQLIMLDAAETLSQFLVDGLPDQGLFFEVVGSIVSRVLASNRRLYAFGEMVALLWTEGNHEAAIRLEELWNHLGRSQPFSLFCAYPIRRFNGEVHTAPFSEICKHHTHVIPAESYTSLKSERERHDLVSSLQQKALVLEAEIERRKKAEDELREADRRKDEFLAMLAHELRNPLSAIASGVALLERPKVLEKDKPWIHQVMKRQVSQLSLLLDDLLDVSRITTGKVDLKIDCLYLGDIIKRAVQTVRSQFEKQNHKLSVSSLGCIPCWINADAARLEQILANLLSNSAKYTPREGEITFTYEQKDKDIIISVKDGGVGISAEMLPKIFDLFSQDNRTLDRSQGGLGIGLSIVKRLVELHGGSVTATSEGVGKGSEFIVKFPAAEKPQVIELKARTATSDMAASKKILIVDDNRDTAVALSMLLESEGHQIKVAHRGDDALEIFAEFCPEVALLDIGLPGINGYELAKKVRLIEGLTGIILIAISGYGQAEDRALSAKAGFHHHLVKPVDPEELLHLLQGCSDDTLLHAPHLKIASA